MACSSPVDDVEIRRPRFLTLGEIMSRASHLDDFDVLEKAESDPALARALDWCRPPNWHGSAIGAEKLLVISAEDGIPLAWVPPISLVKGIAAADDRSDRLRILLDKESIVVEACREAIDACDHRWLRDVNPLAAKAVIAYGAGFREASMALAVSVSDPLAIWASERRIVLFNTREEYEAEQKASAKKGRRYPRALDRSRLPETVVDYEVPTVAVLAPVLRFFVSWWPESGIDPPEQLSRHLVAHRPSIQHFTRANALLALMLMTSLLRHQQDYCEDVDDGED